MSSLAVSSVSATSGVSGSSSSGSDIAKLQQQLRALYTQLRDEASSNDDAKTKAQQEQLIQAQIQMVQAQIQALQEQRNQQAASRGNASADHDAGKDDTAPQTSSSKQVDLYA